MNKIDRRRNYKIVIDTETCPLDRDLQDVVPTNMFTYDIGWAVVDTNGNVYEARSFIVAEIFLDERALMKSAYYADKIPNYWNEIHAGTRQIKKFYNIREILLADIETYGITEIYAHNMRFDYGTLNNTERWLTKSKYRHFFPHDIDICDTLKMATDTIAKMPSYRKFCEENGFMTNHKTPRPQLKAETLYRFISKDLDFVEAHTGLEDVMIEKEIMVYCLKKHNKEMRRLLFEK